MEPSCPLIYPERLIFICGPFGFQPRDPLSPKVIPLARYGRPRFLPPLTPPSDSIVPVYLSTSRRASISFFRPPLPRCAHPSSVITILIKTQVSYEKFCAGGGSPFIWWSLVRSFGVPYLTSDWSLPIMETPPPFLSPAYVRHHCDLFRISPE